MTLLEQAGEQLGFDKNPRDLEVGELVVRRTERRRTNQGHEYALRFVSIGDISPPEDRARLNGEIDEQNAILEQHPEYPTPTRSDGFQTTNPVFEWFYNRYPGQDSMQYWRDNLMPNAPALYPLQRPHDAGRLFPGGVNDLYSQDIFINAEDSIAIRARAVVLRELELELVSQSPKKVFKALAMGAGAGVPDIDAMVAAYEKHGKTILLDMIDFNRGALNLGEQLAGEAGIPVNDEAPTEKGHISTKRADFRAAFKGEAETYDIVEMLGLWEYLDDELCTESIAGSYRLLKPGGILVVSNMRSDRSQLAFNMKGIAWPGVEPRSEDQIVNLAVAAGVDPANITLTISDDGVYNVMEIRKP